jgi:Uma2 family endonuclease
LWNAAVFDILRPEVRRKMDVTIETHDAPQSAIPQSLADLHRVIAAIGDIPPERVRLHPSPGTATEQDLLDADDHHNRICELIDGILVEKPMGATESELSVEIGSRIRIHMGSKKYGRILGEGGFLRLKSGLVRAPDVTFIRFDRFADPMEAKKPIPQVAPDLAVEILSTSNTRKEMALKRVEYFGAGTRLVWEADHRKRTVTVYTAPDRFVVLDDAGTLDGADVLPGFSLSVKEWFDSVLEPGEAP